MILNNVKMMQIKTETWTRLGNYKTWPERTSVDAVLNWVLDEFEKDRCIQ